LNWIITNANVLKPSYQLSKSALRIGSAYGPGLKGAPELQKQGHIELRRYA